MKRPKTWMNSLLIQYLKASGGKGFSLLAGINRDVKPGQVDKITESIKLMGTVRPVVVTKISFVNGKLTTYIIDGQHLYHAFLKLGVDIPYTVIEVKNMEDLVEKIALLNSSSKSWTMGDYVTAWSNLHEDYKKLNSWIDTYNIEASVIASIMSGSVGFTGGSINNKIKKGLFRVKDEKYNLELLNQVRDLLAILPKASRFETKYLCNEYLTFVKNCPATGPNKYNHENFLKNVKKNTRIIGAAIQAETKLASLFHKLNKNGTL